MCFILFLKQHQNEELPSTILSRMSRKIILSTYYETAHKKKIA